MRKHGYACSSAYLVVLCFAWRSSYIIKKLQYLLLLEMREAERSTGRQRAPTVWLTPQRPGFKPRDTDREVSRAWHATAFIEENHEGCPGEATCPRVTRTRSLAWRSQEIPREDLSFLEIGQRVLRSEWLHKKFKRWWKVGILCWSLLEDYQLNTSRLCFFEDVHSIFHMPYVLLMRPAEL